MAAISLPGATVPDIMNRADFPETLAKLNASLGDVESLAVQVDDLKKDTMEKEAVILKAVLERVTPIVPFLSKDYELYYRRELVILTRRDEVKLETNSGFYSEFKLSLYENGSLVRTHRYGDWSNGSRPGWEMTDEEELTPKAAIVAFGLAAIAEGLTWAFEEAASTIVLKEELEGKLRALSRVLEALA